MYDMNTNNKIPSAGSVFLLQYPQLFYQKLHKACYCLFNIGISLQICNSTMPRVRDHFPIQITVVSKLFGT